MSLKNDISFWIKDYVNSNNLDSLVIGISGGIDSAVTSTLCAMTGCKTIVITMPIHQNPDETNRGKEHCIWLSEKFNNVEILHINSTLIYDQFLLTIPSKYNHSLSLANTRARIRMSILYLIAGNSKGIVVGTGNKVEDFGVGFFTKYGDGGVDISPIADCNKTEVWELGKELGILKEIIDAPPTDGLWDDGRSDEDQIGATYVELEEAMENGTGKAVDILYKFNKQNKHKMEPIPTFKL